MVKFGTARLLMALWLVGGVAGCLATTHDAQETSGIDGAYAPYLARQYQMMAGMFEVNGFEDAARQFNHRARSSQRGYWVRPITPDAENANMDQNKIDQDQSRAHETLMLGLTQVMNQENALWLARAQVNYECWVEIAEENCHRDFKKAMDGVSIPQALLQTQSVYFEADSSKLSDETRETLAGVAMAARLNKMVTLRLVGSTDYQDRNASLALRRGIAVRNMLVQMGLPLDRMIVEGEDHSDTILSKQTRENSGDTQKRRVDIVLEPIFGHRENAIEAASGEAALPF